MYLVFYVHRVDYIAVGLTEVLDGLAGSWDLTNHNVLLQAQEFPGTVCLNIWEAVYDSSLSVISRSCGSSTVSSSPFGGKRHYTAVWYLGMAGKKGFLNLRYAATAG